MQLVARTESELRDSLRAAAAARHSIASVELAGFRDIVRHVPEDLTVTVGAGCTLSSLAAALRVHRQWLPIDPPRGSGKTLGALAAANTCGPRIFGYGSWRDWVLGMTVMLADGTRVRSGGQVVKNVAGYDLLKLFIGSRGGLGIILELSLKVASIPQAELTVRCTWEDPSELRGIRAAILQTPLQPVIFDVHRRHPQRGGAVVLGFEGTLDEVEWTLGETARLGFHPVDLSTHPHPDEPLPAPDWGRTPFLPSRLPEVVQGLGEAPFLARAGNGILWSVGASPVSADPHPLLRRLKQQFDPLGLFRPLQTSS